MRAIFRSRFAVGTSVVLSLVLCCAVLTLAFGETSAAPQEAQSDVVCDTLLRDYVLNVGKIESRAVNAAIQLLGARGRAGKYWQVVLRRFQETDANGRTAIQSSRLLTVLTIMLEYDGQARWLLARPDALRQSAWIPQITLSNDVLDTIISKAKQADHNQLDAYVIALVAAHDPRGQAFLKSVLESTDGTAEEGTRFHAAVGLAELGDTAGFRWLVESAPGGFIWSAPHVETSGGSCLDSRVHALNDLVGVKKETIEEWQAWWKVQKEIVAPNGRVKLRYP